MMRLLLIIANPYKLHIVRKAAIPKGKPVIYASTHGFKDDIQIAYILMNDHAYLQLGGLDHFFKSPQGILAWLIGVALVDRYDKNSRAASLPKMKLAMQFGANILMFPEGAWNLTDSLLVRKLYSGVYRLAMSENALIIPIATHIENKNCYAILDEPFDISVYDKEKGLCVLRDKMGSLKFELMEQYSSFSRNELESAGKSLKAAWEEQKEVLLYESKHYRSKKHELYTPYYIDKSITVYAEAFAHLRDIKITKDNAFLLRPDRFEK